MIYPYNGILCSCQEEEGEREGGEEGKEEAEEKKGEEERGGGRMGGGGGGGEEEKGLWHTWNHLSYILLSEKARGTIVCIKKSPLILALSFAISTLGSLLPQIFTGWLLVIQMPSQLKYQLFIE